MSEITKITVHRINYYGVKPDLSYQEIDSSNIKPPYAYKYVIGICEGIYQISKSDTKAYSDIMIYEVNKRRFNALESGNWTYEFSTTSGILGLPFYRGNWLLVNRLKGQTSDPKQYSLDIKGVIEVLREFEGLPKDGKGNIQDLKAENLELKKKVKELRSAIRAAKKTLSSL